MMINGLTWLAVWLGVGAIGEGVGFLLGTQEMTTSAVAVVWITRTFDCLWLAYGLYRWRNVMLVKRATVIVIATAAAQLATLICAAVGWWNLPIAIEGIWTMSVGFYLGLLLLRLLLSPGWPICGIARTLINEAICMKVPLIFLVLLALFIPILPLVIDPHDFLKYRIQTFLTASMIVVSLMLSLLTIFLAVGTISYEVSQRQIFLTMSKPVGRAQYLLGKWVGIAALNLLLVAVCGVAIYNFTRLLANSTPRDAQDKQHVDQQILVARVSQKPNAVSDVQMENLYLDRLAQLRVENPDRYGQTDDPESDLSPTLRKQIQRAVISRWYSLGPRSTNTYVFKGLGEATRIGETIQLRLKPKATSTTADGFVHLRLRVNSRPYPIPPLADDNYHVFDIDSRQVDPFGKLELQIRNAVMNNRNQPSISFNAKDGIEVFYKVDSFEANLIRSMAILWLRLIFLAMLGLAAGSFLTFPVACLLCAMIYVTAASSGFITESLESYAAFPKDDLPWFQRIVGVPELVISNIADGKWWDGFKVIIRLLGSSFMMLIPSFARYNPTPLLSDGRLVSNNMLAYAALWIGVVWTGVVALIGYVIFRTRELARITV
jgi:ABC-type transport system involved in multi-copper enzyme maturation permease subunit